MSPPLPSADPPSGPLHSERPHPETPPPESPHHETRQSERLEGAPLQRGSSALPNVALERLQQWMQAVVVCGGSVEAALSSSEACAAIPAERLEEVVLPSKTLSATARLEIYREMYPLRMIEALESDYPALRHYLGEDPFASLTKRYVQAFPSRSYTLNRLGDHLPEFLSSWQEHPEREFLHDLARLELAVTEVFDAPESPVLTPEALAVVPAETWGAARLRPIAAFRLLAFRYHVDVHLDAAHEKRPSPRPRRRASWIAVYRRDFAVRRLALSRVEHQLLSDLAGGTTLGEALAATTGRLRAGEVESKVFRWFRDWIAQGMWQSVERR